MQFIDGFQETEIWDVGDIIGRVRDKTALARADLPKSVALDVGLTVELAPGPHPLHADVGGWPPDKDKQKLIAIELCVKSTLSLRPATL